MTQLILASGSAIRRTLLERAGLPVQVVPASIDEVLPEAAAEFLRNAKTEQLATAGKS